MADYIDFEDPKVKEALERLGYIIKPAALAAAPAEDIDGKFDDWISSSIAPREETPTPVQPRMNWVRALGLGASALADAMRGGLGKEPVFTPTAISTMQARDKELRDLARQQQEDKAARGMYKTLTGEEAPAGMTARQMREQSSVIREMFRARQPMTGQLRLISPEGGITVGATGLQKDVTKSLSTPKTEKTPLSPAAQKPVDPALHKAITQAKVELAEARPMVKLVTDEISRVEELNENSFGGKVGEAQVWLRSKANIGTGDEKFKNTVDVVNTMQAQVAKVLKSTFGGQLSDGERMYLNNVYGALPGLSQAERAIAMKNVKTMLKGRLDASESKLRELSGYTGIEIEPEPSGIRKTSSGKTYRRIP